LSQGLEKLGRDQVNRPQIGTARLPACEVPVSNEGARMGIALDAMALLRRLAEMVNPIGATATTELEGGQILHRPLLSETSGQFKFLIVSAP
jgi:hypothetical protein